jgi:TolB-like protein/Tfp pilus assembly protein PilF
LQPAEPVLPKPMPPARATRFPLRTGLMVVLGTALLAVIAAIWLGSPFARSDASGIRIRSLAVLPLKNFSGIAEQDYFADAMTEALINDLARIRNLQVASRTSVMAYKARTLPISSIARELKVDALVEGSVMLVGRRVRITAQLIDGKTDRHLWSDTYEREYKDILFLQKEVARAVAEEIQITLTPEEKQKLAKAQPVNPEAFEAYVKGRYFWNQRSRDSLVKAAELFEESVRLAPDFGLAYSGLADTHNLLAHYGFRDPEDSFKKSKTAALKALQLDPSAAEPHASLALISMAYERNWKAAEEGFRKAIHLNPGYPTSHHWLALCLIGQGRTQEAIQEAERARELDPVSMAPNTFLAQVFLLARQYPRAEQKCLETLEIHPTSDTLRLILTESYWREGKVKQALAEIDKIAKSGQEDPAQLAITRALIAGEKASAKRLFHQYLSGPKGPANPMFCAQTHALLGETDQAFACLEKAYLRRDSGLLIIKVDPTFDGLRNDRRFARLAAQLGLG